ncbi:MAG: ABC transporter ATP-binding protein [Bacillota bacterium]
MLKLGEQILRIEELKKYFFTAQGTVKAVDGVSIGLDEGETLGLVGESGSGKSTVAYTVVGIYSATGGRILFRGRDISGGGRRPKSLKKGIQIVFQDPGTSLNPRQTIRQILGMPLGVHGIVPPSEVTQKVRELLERVQLPASFIHKHPLELGEGEKQSVAVARALAVNPSLIVLDEPTSALDVSQQAKVINLLLELQKTYNFSYLFITHDLSVMRNVATRIAIMYLGRIVEVSLASEFFHRPLHPYTKMLISSVPVVSEEEERLRPTKIMSRGEIPSPVNVPPGCGFHPRCPDRMELCAQSRPDLVMVEMGHQVACHKYEPCQVDGGTGEPREAEGTPVAKGESE